MMDQTDVHVDEWNFKVEIRNPSRSGVEGWWWSVTDVATGAVLVDENNGLLPTRYGARAAARRWVRGYVHRQGMPLFETWFVKMKRSG